MTRRKKTPEPEPDTTELTQVTEHTYPGSAEPSVTIAANQARNLRLQKLDEDGEPVGEPVELPDAVVTWMEQAHPGPIERAQFEAFARIDKMEVARGPIAYEPGTAVASIEIEQALTPEAFALLQEATRVPIPTAVVHVWWPAQVQLPAGVDIDGQSSLYPCKVYATPQGLYVYRQRPADPEQFRTGAHPAFWSSIDYEKTTPPTVGNLTRRASNIIHTAAGAVTIKKNDSCGCGHPLKRWRPDWARTRISWDDAVKLWTQDRDARSQGGDA